MVVLENCTLTSSIPLSKWEELEQSMNSYNKAQHFQINLLKQEKTRRRCTYILESDSHQGQRRSGLRDHRPSRAEKQAELQPHAESERKKKKRVPTNIHPSSHSSNVVKIKSTTENPKSTISPNTQHFRSDDAHVIPSKP